MELFLSLGWGVALIMVALFCISEDSRAGTSETLDQQFKANNELLERYRIEADEVSHLRQQLFDSGKTPEEIHTTRYLRVIQRP